MKAGRPIRRSTLSLALVLAVAALWLSGRAWLASRPTAEARGPAGSAAAGRTASGGEARDLQMSRARERLEAADHAGAAEALDRALEASPSDPEALALQVRVFRSMRHYAAARAAASRILDAFPGSPLAQILLGSVALQEGDAASARRDLERAVALDTSSSLALAQLAALDVMQGRLGNGIDRARRAISLDPGNVTAMRVLAAHSRSVPELIRLHERLLEAGPYDATTAARLSLLRSIPAPEINHLSPLTGEVVVPCEAADDGRLYVRASAGGGRSLRLLVDTGASGLLVSELRARDLGLRLTEFSESSGVGGATRHSHPILLDRLSLEGVRARALLATASRLPAGVDGILNPLLLAPSGSGVRIVLRPGRRQLIYRPASVAAPSPTEGPRVVVDYLADGLQMIVPIMLAGRPARALLDSGAAVEMADAAALARFGGIEILPARPDDDALIGFAGEVRASGMAPSVPVRIAGREQVIARLYLIDLNTAGFRFSVDLDAIIGIRALSPFDLTIDPAAGTVTFDPRS